jgi:hypothetical protein
MTFLPVVVRAQYQGGHRIRLAFDDGAQGTVNFRRWLKGPVFEPLRDPDYFRRFHLDGGTVVWPNGADIAPETLYASVVAHTRATTRSARSNPRRSPPRRRTL